ncbi:MAG TPA: hypothetical protein VIP56_01300, partial [Nitrososphaeraceae archaeon]
RRRLVIIILMICVSTAVTAVTAKVKSIVQKVLWRINIFDQKIKRVTLSHSHRTSRYDLIN